MWFLFGFITTLMFALYYGYKRFNARWRGERGRIGAVEYEYAPEHRKDVLVGFKIGIEAYGDYDFALRRETWFDRWCKRVGIASEHQVGSDEFDREIYVISDDPQFCQVLSSKSEMRDHVMLLFRSGASKFCELKEIRYNQEKLWLDYKVKDGFRRETIQKFAEEYSPRLVLMAAELVKAGQEVKKQRRDPFLIKSILLLSISSGMLINGFLQFMRINLSELPLTLEVGELIGHAIGLGLVIVALLIVATIYLLGRSSRTHLVLLEIILAGSLGAFVTSAAELRDLNMELDRGEAAHHVVKALGKHISKGRKSTSYYLHVEDWTGRERSLRLSVGSGLYGRVAVGDAIEIVEKPGYFGYRWMEKMDKPLLQDIFSAPSS